jgi:PAS domain S-box-containing protein
LFHEIAANVKDGIWVSDKEDRIIFFNTAMENIAGVTADRVIGLKVTSDFGKETTQYLIEYYQKAKTSLISTEYKAEVVTPSGRVTIQRGWCIPRISDGKYNGIICTIKDITYAKRCSCI